jgi:hypothetical protein
MRSNWTYPLFSPANAIAAWQYEGMDGEAAGGSMYETESILFV